MCPRAGEALYGAARLAAAEGLSSRFCELLQGGFSTLPAALRAKYRGLADWNGIGELRRTLARVLELRGEPLVLVASRSSQLMRLAARLLFLRCRRVLTTDLEWPGYAELLAREAWRTGRELITAPVSALVFGDRARAELVVSALSDSSRLRDCDGLFMSAVSYHGVRLPVGPVCELLAESRRTRLVVIDGSQATAHVPVPGLGSCDLFLTGCHKWLCAHLPLGVAVCPRARSARFVRATLAEMARSCELDDPLLQFTEGMETERLPPYGETVAVTCLFTARAAAEEFLANGGVARRFPTLLKNAEGAAAAAHGTGWEPLRPDLSLHSGMLLLEPPRSASGAVAPDDLRRRFQEAGVVITAYERGRVRLSVPNQPWRAGELDWVRSALRSAA